MKTTYVVYSTNDYDKFKKLEGNRDVSELRVRKIMSSIEKVGYIKNPIVVNEKYEIIDGQGRVEALSRLGLPIDYVVHEGAGIRECVEMNINMTNWTMTDYIKSYADQGVLSYQYFLNLLKQFPKMKIGCIHCALTGKGQIGKNAICDGTFTCTAEQYMNAIETLEYIEGIKPHLKNVHGRLDLLINALIFIYQNEPSVDIERLSDVIDRNSNMLGECATIEGALRDLEKLYNRRLRGTLMNFANDYIEFLRTNHSTREFMRFHNRDAARNRLRKRAYGI